MERGLNCRHEQLANLRLASIGLAVAVAWLVLVRHDGSAAWMLVPLATFLGLAVWHDRVLQARDRASRAVQHYSQGLARLEGRWTGSSETGGALPPPGSPVRRRPGPLRSRLTICGPSRPRESRAGRVARWLLAPATPREVHARQEAVAELRARLNLREDIAVLGGSPGAT